MGCVQSTPESVPNSEREAEMGNVNSKSSSVKSNSINGINNTFSSNANVSSSNNSNNNNDVVTTNLINNSNNNGNVNNSTTNNTSANNTGNSNNSNIIGNDGNSNINVNNNATTNGVAASSTRWHSVDSRGTVIYCKQETNKTFNNLQTHGTVK